MRRVLVLCLLVMLPFQGLWAAVASITALDTPCAMSRQAAPHGDHGGDADASAAMPGAMPDCDDGASAGPCCDGSCSNCHGHVPVAMISPPVFLGSTCSEGVVLVCSARGAPDHIPEHPLRPPLRSHA